MRGASDRGQLLGDIPPPGAPLQRERDIVTAGEPRQPGPQVRAVSRGDLAAPDLPSHGVETVEGQLLPVDIQPAYDGHRDLLKLPRAPQAPVRELLTQLIVTRLSWGGPPGVAATRGTRQLSANGRASRCMSSICPHVRQPGPMKARTIHGQRPPKPATRVLAHTDTARAPDTRGCRYIARASDLDDLNIEHGVVIRILSHDRNTMGNGRGRDPAVVDRHLPACRAKPRYQQRPGLGDGLVDCQRLKPLSEW